MSKHYFGRIAALAMLLSPTVTNADALNDQALEVMQKIANDRSWAEVFSHVELFDEWTIDRNVFGIIERRYIGGFAYAKWPEGHCTKQLFSFQQIHDGSGFMDQLTYSGVGNSEEVSCDGIVVDEDLLARRTENTQAARNIFKTDNDALNAEYRKFAESIFPEFGFLPTNHELREGEVLAVEALDLEDKIAISRGDLDSANGNLRLFVDEAQFYLVGPDHQCHEVRSIISRPVKLIDANAETGPMSFYTGTSGVNWESTGPWEFYRQRFDIKNVKCLETGATGDARAAAVESIKEVRTPGEITVEAVKRHLERRYKTGGTITFDPQFTKAPTIELNFDDGIESEEHLFYLTYQTANGRCYEYVNGHFNRSWNEDGSLKEEYAEGSRDLGSDYDRIKCGIRDAMLEAGSIMVPEMAKAVASNPLERESLEDWISAIETPNRFGNTLERAISIELEDEFELGYIENLEDERNVDFESDLRVYSAAYADIHVYAVTDEAECLRTSRAESFIVYVDQTGKILGHVPQGGGSRDFSKKGDEECEAVGLQVALPVVEEPEPEVVVEEPKVEEPKPEVVAKEPKAEAAVETPKAAEPEAVEEPKVVVEAPKAPALTLDGGFDLVQLAEFATSKYDEITWSYEVEPFEWTYLASNGKRRDGIVVLGGQDASGACFGLKIKVQDHRNDDGSVKKVTFRKSGRPSKADCP